MITIIDKTKCCGCGACFNICPKKAISMEYDNEGFLYPKVDNSKCVKCELCLKVCSVINNKKENKVLEVYGAKNKNVDEQLKSSSGGLFSVFANYVLEQKGIVFGASFDKNWKVIHKYIENKENLDDLRRSKYVQSDINTTYKQAKEFLDDDKLVLFTGTPCQITGLNNYLQKDYENLITIDIICHGVPSPKVWEKFLMENFDIKTIKEINFRDKYIGWISYFDSYTLNNKKHKFLIQKVIKLIRNQNKRNGYIYKYLYSPFYKGFLQNLFLRKSCHQCVSKKHLNSDFTIGDFWGIEKILPNMYDRNGVSVLTINSQKAKNIFEKTKSKLEYEKINYDDILKYNPLLIDSVSKHPKREEFFKSFQTQSLKKLIIKLISK